MYNNISKFEKIGQVGHNIFIYFYMTCDQFVENAVIWNSTLCTKDVKCIILGECEFSVLGPSVASKAKARTREIQEWYIYLQFSSKWRQNSKSRLGAQRTQRRVLFLVYYIYKMKIRIVVQRLSSGLLFLEQLILFMVASATCIKNYQFVKKLDSILEVTH